MTSHRKVVWAEGIFLRPQHFQQQERYFESLIHARALSGEGHFWGFHELVLDIEALSLGKVALQRARGIFPDGIPFSFPEQAQSLLPLDFPENAKNEKVFLALPLRRAGQDEMTFDSEADSLTRYSAVVEEFADGNSMGGEPAEIQVGDIRIRLLLESELTSAWCAIGVVHVVERRPDNQLILERSYIPPMLACENHELLRGFVRELHGLLHQRGDAISGRLQQPGRGGISEVGDFLMLGLINRWEPYFSHLSSIPHIHPERLYAVCLQLAGDLVTFTRDNRRPGEFPIYDHDDLTGCFTPVMLDLRRSLSMVFEQNAIHIDLQDRNNGVRVALIRDVELLKHAKFVLAVHADMSTELVRSRFPTQVKIGPVEKLRDLVNLHLPGITLQSLPIAPRQIPYHAGYNYFELDTSNDLWKQLDRSGGLALHVAGDFPNLNLEFWAIR